MARATAATYRWAAIVAVGGFLFGFDATVISGVIGYVTPAFKLTDWQIGMVVAAPTMMGIPAALTVSTLADLFGRRRVLLVLALLYTVAAVWSALATGFWTLVFARAVGGYAFGSLGLAPIYISEISPADKRGQIVSFNQLNIVIGFAAAYFTNFFLQRVSQSGASWVVSLGLDANAWRYMLGVAAVPALLWFLGLLRVPESPRWLALQGREAEARAVFARVIPAARIDATVAEIALDADRASAPIGERVRALLDPRLRFVLLVGLILAVAQQITGINAVYFYAPTIFEQSGVGTDAAFAQAVLIGIVNIVFTLIAMALIDRAGRKPLLIAGIIGVTLSMATISYGFSKATYQLPRAEIAALHVATGANGLEKLAGVTFDSDVEFKQALRGSLDDAALKANEAHIFQVSSRLDPVLILIGILGFVASFAMSLGPVMWVMLPEIYPNAVRGFAMAAVGFFNTLTSFAVQFLFPWQLSNLGSAVTFGLYGAFGIVFLGLFLWLIPETRGRSLEDLEAHLVRQAP